MALAVALVEYFDVHGYYPILVGAIAGTTGSLMDIRKARINP
jgi:hypothetical protein